MAVIYATLIVKGKKTINDVPPVIREQVKQILIDLDCAPIKKRMKNGNTCFNDTLSPSFCSAFLCHDLDVLIFIIDLLCFDLKPIQTRAKISLLSLDVYKRQTFNFLLPSTYLDTSSSMLASTLSISAISPELALFFSVSALSWICLLYTSRCV